MTTSQQMMKCPLCESTNLNLGTIGDQVPVSDDVLLGMDDNQFDSYFNKRVADKNTADKQAIENKAKAEADAKAEAERKEAEAKAQKEKEEAEARAKAEAEAARIAKVEADKKAEAERLAKEKSWQEFLIKNGYTEDTKGNFIINETISEYILFKRIDSYKK